MGRRLLDLFCGGGGCSAGYARAGWEVTGVDRVFHECYPDPTHSLVPPPADIACTFIQADAMDVVADLGFLSGFDAVAASPPCPGYSTITPGVARGDHPQLIAPLVEALRAWGGPYVIENVEGAAWAMPGAVRLCGSSFGLRVRRHRLFLSNLPLTAPACDHARQGEPIGVYGHHPETGGGRFPRPVQGTSRGVRAASTAEAQAAMGIDWMGWDDLTDAIPPAYTQHLGEQVLRAVGAPT